MAAGGTLSASVYTLTPNLAAGDYDTITWKSNNPTILSVTNNNSASTTVSGLAQGSGTISVEYRKGGASGTLVASGTSGTITVTGAPKVYITTTQYSTTPETTCTLSGSGSAVNLYAHVTNPISTASYTYNWAPTNQGTIIYTDKYYNQNYNDSVLYVQGIAKGTASITLTVYENNVSIGTATMYITVGNTGIQPSVTVYGGSDYVFSSTDVNNKASVASQIASLVSAYGGRYLHHVIFTTVTDIHGDLSASRNTYYYADGISSNGGGRLSDIVFSPKQTGTATFSFQAYYAYNNTNIATEPIYGTLSITVTGSVTSGDITYSASIGQDVNFDIRDFENYYYEKTRGTLNYVTFTLPSGGYLYSDRTRLGVGNTCFASPRTNQIDLAGVYFTPTGTTATRAGSVSIPFTAYGTNGASRAGTVVITYLSGSAKDITYTALNNNAVALRSSDFTDAYRQVVGSNAPSGLTIQFQDVPTNGTLTYKDSSRSSSTAVTLRSGNIQSYKFTTLGSGTNRLGDVTYTANSNGRSDTISYIAYNGSTPQFTGKVVFNANSTANSMSVILYSTGGSTASFNYNAFVTANAVVMAGCTSIRIVGMPTSGTLTYNGAAVSAAGTDILPATLSQVVYRPNAGFNGTDKVTFVCYGANGSVAGSGQVNIIVSGNASSSGGASNISQFKDVAANAWYATDLSTLVSRGIMQGKGEGRFDPTGELKYGEALKIFLLSAGYSAQEGTGKDWAAGYKTLAVNNGWISSNIDLDAKISRNAMAELAARVLGISSSSTVPPTWKDGTSNGYANALYYTNPQILVGNADGTFKGNTTLQRAEICKIAARVLNYKGNQQSTQAPGWLS